MTTLIKSWISDFSIGFCLPLLVENVITEPREFLQLHIYLEIMNKLVALVVSLIHCKKGWHIKKDQLFLVTF